MARYTARLDTVPSAHSLPPLLVDFGKWLETQTYGALGYFELIATEVPREWSPEVAERLQRDAFSFLSLPDGSLLALLRSDAKAPLAVVLLGSEGETRTVASSLEEFLLALSKGETELGDLDEGEDDAREALAKWLKEKKVSAPKVKRPVDFNVYLSGETPEAEPTPAARPESAAISALPPGLRALARLMGRRADDAEVVAYVTETLGKKVPASTSDVNDSAHVVAKPQGIEMLFSHDVLDERYPPIAKTRRAFVPYLSVVWLGEKFAEADLPQGLTRKMTAEQMRAVLGEPDAPWNPEDDSPKWTRVLDAEARIVLMAESSAKGPRLRLLIDAARELTTRRVDAGLFVAWCALRGLLDTERLAAPAPLLAQLQRREVQGSALVDAVLPRGLWDAHLRDLPGLRAFAYAWFHRLEGVYIRDDLARVFGLRTGPRGHDEVVLDEDTWAAVDQATPVLDERFATWVKRS
ncbi:hypothetical protein LZ198_12730 [Myxococcus sp. K15C18031901]|uniref:hypothetical protein n=1 Tax=Myxococcus dinghuensis TaxID=2906761 RepID=UPI0020A74767|nr:hypothetical protein [Myxococcus dinghuensis]MCP3099733.1 hypothetical protein [Myxococcus dinghuensis]